MHRWRSEPPTVRPAQHARALAEFRRALEMGPGNNRVHFQLGVTFTAMGQMEDAIRELEIAARPAHGHNSRVEAYLGYAYAAAGRTHDARDILKELERTAATSTSRRSASR